MAAYVIIGIIIFIIDQFSKFLLTRYLYLGQSLPLIRNIFHITLVHNTGSAFGIFKNQGLFFVIISLAVIAFIILYWIKEPKKLQKEKLLKLGLVLILSGALGNLADRLRFGYVIDFLDFRIWPVFNLADSSITIGTILIIYQTIFMKEKK